MQYPENEIRHLCHKLLGGYDSQEKQTNKPPFSIRPSVERADADKTPTGFVLKSGGSSLGYQGEGSTNETPPFKDMYPVRGDREKATVGGP